MIHNIIAGIFAVISFGLFSAGSFAESGLQGFIPLPGPREIMYFFGIISLATAALVFTLGFFS